MATVTLSSAFDTDNFWTASTAFISDDGSTYKFQNAAGFVKVTGTGLTDNGSGVPTGGNYTAIQVYSDNTFTTLIASYSSASNIDFATYFTSGGVTALGGADTITGSSGNDTMTGGAGNDIFKVSTGNDTITDFRSLFTATLTGGAQVPPVVTAATGQATLFLNGQNTVLQVAVTTTGLDLTGTQTPATADNVNGFHIHNADAGVNGPIVWDIKDDPQTIVSGPAGTVNSVWTDGDAPQGLGANLTDLFADGLYLNIHTVANSGGEIRGQIHSVNGDVGANKIDLTALNIGSFATWQAITADVSGSATMTTVANGVTSTLTTTDVTEAMFTADDFIFAGTVAETLTGTTNADDLFGAGGNDTLNGDDGADRLFGETDNDTLNGGAGTDMLVGGLGKDILNGGADADIFDFNLKTESLKGGNRDVILDFARGVDDIDLHDIDASSKKAGDQIFKFIKTQAFHHKAGELHYVTTNKPGTAHDKVIVEGDIDGNGKADFQIELSHITKLAAGDFLL